MKAMFRFLAKEGGRHKGRRPAEELARIITEEGKHIAGGREKCEAIARHFATTLAALGALRGWRPKMTEETG